jgi:hypothetical protein
MLHSLAALAIWYALAVIGIAIALKIANWYMAETGAEPLFSRERADTFREWAIADREDDEVAALDRIWEMEARPGRIA